jgi:hypothetical protein
MITAYAIAPIERKKILAGQIPRGLISLLLG